MNIGPEHRGTWPARVHFVCWGFLALVIGVVSAASADSVDDTVRSAMAAGQICGLSLAIIDGGSVVRAAGYGTTAKDVNQPVSPTTLFQAGSVSKPLAAMGALWLVDQGALTLDEDVNGKLTSWKIPENQFTASKKVTLRELLSHTAGFNVHGFSPGYAQTEPMPTLIQVLDGQPPAKSKPIRVEAVPGTQWKYSGGGYTVMQQLVIDLTRQPFDQFLQKTVLSKLGMQHSTFEQALPDAMAKSAATGYAPGGVAIEGGWRVFPTLAASGLWTTPTDLAQFAIEMQRSAAGRSNKVLSAAMTAQMLTSQMNNDGLGLFLAGRGATMRFWHSGRHDGFDAMLVAYIQTGQGAVVMIDTNDTTGAIHKILRAIARQYHWMGYTKPQDDPSLENKQ
jgi:CubicO group peptidase (beta-lactamase class C family)